MQSGHNPTDLHEQERIKADEAAAARVLRELEIDDLKWLMAHRQGRRIMWRILSAAGVYRTTFHESQKVQDFREGMRNSGLVWVNEIHEACPDAYELMKREQNPHARSRTGSADGNATDGR